jgi:diguanylate cyclase (GGDEF)-like protein
VIVPRPPTAARLPSPRALSGDARIWTVNALLLAVAVWAGLVHVNALPAPSALLSIPLWLLALAFAASEVFVLHVHAGSRSRSFTSFSLSEIPLVLGLAFAAPVGLVLARVVGGAVALVVARRQSPVKLVFNLVLFTLEAMAAVSLYHVLLAGREPAHPVGWVAGYAAVIAASSLGTLLVHAAIALHQWSWQGGLLPRLLRTSFVANATNTTLGLLGVVVMSADVRAAWLLGAVAGLILLAYRGYAALDRKHASMEALHEFTRAVSRAEPGESSLQSLLERTRTILRADVAELVRLPSAPLRRLHRQRVLGPEASDEVLVEAVQGSPLLAVVREGRARLVPRSSRRQEDRVLLAELGLSDALIVPVRVDGTERASLVVGDRLGDVESFRRDDLQLLDTIANHVSVALDNERLVEKLSQEAADKRHQALHDALTGLPNRTLFHERAQEAVLHARRTGSLVAVMLLDLDRFKEVNDTLGHHVGDELLQQVGARLLHNVKATDTVARLGGDEFAVLLCDVHSEGAAVRVAERARRALEQPFELGSVNLVVGASFGIAMGPEHGEMATVLLQRADVAMYAGKSEQRGVVVYSPDVDTHSPRRLALVGELRKALAEGGLDVHYQPKADARTGEIVGAEALVRWLHPIEGFIGPDEFIPIAERTGMIHELTAFVLRTALRQCRDWRRAGARVDVAVNVAVGSLLHVDFPEEVRTALEEAGVSARALTLEITESSIMADPTRSIRVLSALSAMGVQLAIDDFGTGYSSLSQLKQLPVDELKIDRSFIQDMTSDDDDATIVRSTIDLGHNLGLRVVAEGVEDAETWRRLKTLGCDVIQGFYLARALEPASFTRWLTEWNEGVDLKILPPAEERRRLLELSAEGLELLRDIDALGDGFDGPS